MGLTYYSPILASLNSYRHRSTDLRLLREVRDLRVHGAQQQVEAVPAEELM
jgi:hypothetical protein